MGNFNDYRFAGLHHSSYSNKYWTMRRVSDDQTRIVVRVANCHLFQTAYGYGLVLDRKHVVWLKNWAVSESFKGNEVMLSKDYFNPKQSKFEHDMFDDDDDALTWEHWLGIAKLQAEQTDVQWAK